MIVQSPAHTVFKFSNEGTQNLGVGTKIDMRTVLSSKTLKGLDVYKNNMITADQLMIKVDNAEGTATGMDISTGSIVDLGSGSIIDVRTGNPKSSSKAVSISGKDAELRANDLSIKAFGEGKVKGTAISVTGFASVDLGKGTVIDADYQGIYIGDSKVKADGITMNIKGDVNPFGINSNYGLNEIDLGANSIINIEGQNAMGIWLTGDGYGSDAGDIFTARGTNSRGIMLQGDMPASRIDFKLSDAVIDVAGNYAMYALNSYSKATLKDVSIIIAEDRTTPGSGAFGLHAASGGQYDIHNLTVKAGINSYAVSARSGSHYKIAGNTLIQHDVIDGFAMNADGQNTEISVDGVINIHGAIFAGNQAKIDLTSENSSVITGAINTMTSSKEGRSSIDVTESLREYIDDNGNAHAYIDYVINKVEALVGDNRATDPGIVNLAGQGSVWNVAGNSRLSRLNLTNGFMNLAYGKGCNQVEVADFSGNMSLR